MLLNTEALALPRSQNAGGRPARLVVDSNRKLATEMCRNLDSEVCAPTIRRRPVRSEAPARGEGDMFGVLNAGVSAVHPRWPDEWSASAHGEGQRRHAVDGSLCRHR